MDGGLDLAISKKMGWVIQTERRKRINALPMKGLLVGQAETVKAEGSDQYIIWNKLIYGLTDPLHQSNLANQTGPAQHRIQHHISSVLQIRRVREFLYIMADTIHARYKDHG